MNSFRLRGYALFIALFVAIRSVVGQSAMSPIGRLDSPIDTTRIHAFYELAGAAADSRSHPDWPRTQFLAERAKSDDGMAVALIRLLDRESVIVNQAAPGALSEDYVAGYYLDLLTTVARMHDRRSLNALIAGIGSGSGVAEGTLAEFGDLAVPGVEREVGSGNRHHRRSAVLILREMTARGTSSLSPVSQASIAHTLLQVAKDRTSENRGPAIEGLLPLSSEEIRPVMESIVATESTDSLAPLAFHGSVTVGGGARIWLERHRKP
jgi:hypothetical protein